MAAGLFFKPCYSELMGHFIFHSILVGIFCCVAMDIWQRVLFLIFYFLPTNWATVGRWFIMLINNKIIINENLDI